jgi:hypothetical protein
MRSLLICLCLICALLLGGTGCANQPSYGFDYDRSFDFSQLKTYRWYDDVVPSREADYRQYNSSDKRIREAVAAEMRQHGIVESRTGQADFLINYSIAREEQRVERISGYDRGMHGGAAIGTYGSAVSVGYSTGPSVRVYTEGTALLDVIDVKTMSLVWRGTAQGRLKDDRTMADKRRATVAVARELLAEFPPSS